MTNMTIYTGDDCEEALPAEVATALSLYLINNLLKQTELITHYGAQNLHTLANTPEGSENTKMPNAAHCDATYYSNALVALSALSKTK